MIRKIIWLLLFAALSGCAATPPSVDKRFITGTDGKRGIVVFSATRTGSHGSILSGYLRFTCVSGARGEVPDHGALARYIDGERVPIPISPTLVIDKNRPLGLIHVLELPAGTCRFYFFRAEAHGMAVTTTAVSKKPFSIKFDVMENRTTYIGSFNVDWDSAGGRPSFEDYFERDIAALKKQNPDIFSQNVEKQIATVLHW